MKLKLFAFVLFFSACIPLRSFSTHISLAQDDLSRIAEPPDEPIISKSSFRYLENQTICLEKEGDELPLKDSSVIYMFNSSSDSTPVSKATYEYDAAGNIILSISHQWVEADFSWGFSRKYEYEYDENSNVVTSITYEWDEESNDWLKMNRTRHTYDEQNTQIKYIKYRWNSDSADWIYTEKAEILNTAFDTVVRSGYSIWDTINYNWCELSRRISYYTREGLATLRIDSTRDVDTDTWTLTGKEFCSYSSEGLLLSEEGYSWVNNESDSSGTIKWTHEYDESGHEEILTTFDWNDVEDSWVLQQQQIYSYNTEGYLVEVIRNLINETGDEWLEFMRWELSYLDFLNIEAAYIWQEETSTYEIFSATFDYFKHDPNSVNPVKEADFTVFPNPVKGFITITCELPIEDISIYSLHGMLLLHQDYTGEPIDITALSDGIYLLKVNENSSVAAGKLIRKH